MLRLLHADPDSVEKFGFEEGDDLLRVHLEEVGRAFIDGFLRRMIDTADHDVLVRTIEQKYDSHLIGFSFEGIGMYLALLDLLAFGKTNRLSSFIRNAGQKYDLLVAVGAGFAVPRVPWGLRVMEKYRNRLDPRLGWCPADGFGFHQGRFHHRRFIDRCEGHPRRLPHYDRAPFDSGLGRSIWWVKAASPPRIKKAIDRFPVNRQPELWNGIGTACSFAGGIEQDGLAELFKLAGPYRANVLSGVPLAAYVRERMGHPSHWTDQACEFLLNMTTRQAAELLQAIFAEAEADPEITNDRSEHVFAVVQERLVSRFQFSDPVAAREA